MPNTWVNDPVWDAYNRFFHICEQPQFNKLFARLELFMRTRDLPGHVFDCGVFKGSSTLGWAHMIAAYTPHAAKKVVGFDLFAKGVFDSLPYEREGVERLMLEQMDPDTDYYALLNAIVEKKALSARCELVKGNVAETVGRYLAERPGARISLLHLDVDVYQPTLAILRAAYDRIVPGGLIVLDEYGTEGFGESDALDEFLRERGLRERVCLQMVGHTHSPTAYVQV